MNIAVVTPYFDEDEATLRACHDSVSRQSHPATHIPVADGRPKPWVADFAAQHIVLPVGHKDYGDTPRGIGSLSAASQGFDGIAFLDADNWYRPDHIETVVKLHRDTGAAICSTRRSIHRLDGSLLGYCEASEGDDFVDTNCLAVFGEAFELLPNWSLMPAWAHAVGDRMMWHLLRQSGLKRAHLPRHTVCYRSSYHFHYLKMGETPPAGVSEPKNVASAINMWHAKGLPPFKTVTVLRPPE